MPTSGAVYTNSLVSILPSTSEGIVSNTTKRRLKVMSDVFCLICDQPAVHNHFSQKACNACAAFFRRSVAQKRSYTCKKSEGCNVKESRYKNRCSFCRFHACLAVGMDLRKVMSNAINVKINKFQVDSVLDLIHSSHQANFVARRRYAIDFYGSYTNMCEEKRTATTFLRATKVESRVMRDFFRSLQIISSAEFGTEIESEFCREMLPLWMLLEIVFKTRFHAGNINGKVYYVDDSYLPFNEDGLFQFYLSHNDVYNPAALAQTCMPLFENYLNVANLLQSMSIDQAESLAIIIMSVYRRSMRFRGPNAELKRILDRLFHELNDDYKSSFRNVAVRIGQLTLCVTAIEESLTHIIQQLTIVRLNYKSQNNPGYACYSMKCFADENSNDQTIESNKDTISYVNSN